MIGEVEGETSEHTLFLPVAQDTDQQAVVGGKVNF